MDSERKMALAWWRKLSTSDKFAMCSKYYANLPFGAVSASSSKIEMMYKWEQEDDYKR